MTIVGRLTRDAIVNSLKDEREVVNFTLAVNDYYKPKNGEALKFATYYNCAYWITAKVAAHLKKGTLVEVTGRIYVIAFPGADGTAKASLNCHVRNIKIHAWPKEVEIIKGAAPNTTTDESTDDVPF